jgi:hypothetical protein
MAAADELACALTRWRFRQQGARGEATPATALKEALLRSHLLLLLMMMMRQLLDGDVGALRLMKR